MYLLFTYAVKCFNFFRKANFDFYSSLIQCTVGPVIYLQRAARVNANTIIVWTRSDVGLYIIIVGTLKGFSPIRAEVRRRLDHETRFCVQRRFNANFSKFFIFIVSRLTSSAGKSISREKELKKIVYFIAENRSGAAPNAPSKAYYCITIVVLQPTTVHRT